MFKVTLIAILLAFNCMAVTVTDSMIRAIAMQESSCRNFVVGDLKNPNGKSYGMYQIRKGYLQDVMTHYGKECKQKYGRLLTLEDMRTSPEKSKWVVIRYISYYGSRYEKKTGKKMTAEIAFKLHNGGLQGYNPKYKKLYACSTAYSKLVMRYYGKV